MVSLDSLAECKISNHLIVFKCTYLYFDVYDFRVRILNWWQ